MIEENWILRKRTYKELADRLQIPPIQARIARGRVEEDEVADYLDREGPLLDPFSMRDLREAAQLILKSIQKEQSIMIIGDYDVDGVTSASILYLGLTGLGAKAQIRIPSRTEDGYGMRPYMAEKAGEAGCSLILTCDNGIREFEAVSHAKELGLAIIVTDHHEITKDDAGNDVLPNADYVINPHRADDTYACPNLCGAGVAYKLMEGMYRLAEKHLPDTLLGYAALGTICDIMPLVGENRRIVWQGLRIWNRRPPCGIRAMMDVSGIRSLSVYSCGFGIGPMINAGGRLKDQQDFIRILLTQDEAEAMELATQLKSLNETRQQMTAEGTELAIAEVENRFPDSLVKLVVLPDLHESIAGLVAGKLKEYFYRPSFVLTGQDSVLKGSGRSIEGYSMFQELQKQDHLLERYGGHPMAAGLSVAAQNVEALRAGLEASCSLTEADLRRKVYVDALLPIGQASMALAELLERLTPYGTGNEEPVFAASGLKLTAVRIMGKNRNAARLSFLENGFAQEAITFRMEMLEEVITAKFGADIWNRLARGERFPAGLSVDVLYRISINEYRGVRNVQCMVCNMR